jgi:hypothetical protein
MKASCRVFPAPPVAKSIGRIADGALQRETDVNATIGVTQKKEAA